jgi:hypothetical protein
MAMQSAGFCEGEGKVRGFLENNLALVGSLVVQQQ